jgi:hypothetical protein
LRITPASAVVGSRLTSSTPIADSPPNKPGVSARPFASTVVAPAGALRPLPTSAILPSRISTSLLFSTPCSPTV